MYLISLENFYSQFHTEPCISTSHTYTPGNNTLAKQYQIQRENRVRFSHGSVKSPGFSDNLWTKIPEPPFYFTRGFFV